MGKLELVTGWGIDFLIKDQHSFVIFIDLYPHIFFSFFHDSNIYDYEDFEETEIFLSDLGEI